MIVGGWSCWRRLWKNKDVGDISCWHGQEREKKEKEEPWYWLRRSDTDKSIIWKWGYSGLAYLMVHCVIYYLSEVARRFWKGVEPFKRVWESFTQDLETVFIHKCHNRLHASLQRSNSGDHTVLSLLFSTQVLLKLSFVSMRGWLARWSQTWSLTRDRSRRWVRISFPEWTHSSMVPAARSLRLG